MKNSNILIFKKAAIMLAGFASPVSSYGRDISPNPKGYFYGVIDPVALVADRGHPCVVDRADNLIKCWRKKPNAYMQSKTPKIPNATALVGDFTEGCAASGETVICWGDYKYFGPGERKPPIVRYHETGLKNLRSLTRARGQVCWIGDREDGNSQYGCSVARGEYNPPILENPVSIQTSQDTICAIHKHGIDCWVTDQRYFGSKASGHRDILDAVAIWVDGDRACAIRKNHPTTCWGDTEWHEWSIPEFPFFPSLVNFDETSDLASIGQDHGFCFTNSDKNLICFGENIEYAPSLGRVKEISVARKFYGRSACALDDKGVKCWGDESFAVIGETEEHRWWPSNYK